MISKKEIIDTLKDMHPADLDSISEKIKEIQRLRGSFSYFIAKLTEKYNGSIVILDIVARDKTTDKYRHVNLISEEDDCVCISESYVANKWKYDTFEDLLDDIMNYEMTNEEFNDLIMSDGCRRYDLDIINEDESINAKYMMLMYHTQTQTFFEIKL